MAYAAVGWVQGALNRHTSEVCVQLASTDMLSDIMSSSHMHAQRLSPLRSAVVRLASTRMLDEKRADLSTMGTSCSLQAYLCLVDNKLISAQ